MAENRETFALEIIGDIKRRRNFWRLAFVISLAGNVIFAAVLILR